MTETKTGYYVATECARYAGFGIYDARGMLVASGFGDQNEAIRKCDALNNPNIGDWNRIQLRRITTDPNARAKARIV